MTKAYIIGERKVEYPERKWRDAPDEVVATWNAIRDPEPLDRGELVISEAEMDEQTYRAFVEAAEATDSHILYIEENVEVRAPEDIVPLPPDDPELKAMSLLDGVDPAALSAIGYQDLVAAGADGRGVLVGVGDTGSDDRYYTQEFIRRYVGEFVSYFNDNGMDLNGHGTWCIPAAVPVGSKWTYGKVLGDNGSGSLSNVAKFLFWLTDLARRLGYKKFVASLSLGAEGVRSRALADAIAHVVANGGIVKCATGNDGADQPGTPAAEPEADAVGAVDHRNNLRRASFSNRMGHKAHRGTAAPGVRVAGVNGAMTGTSMATPIDAKETACIYSAVGDNSTTLTVQHRGAALGVNSEQDVGHGVVNGRRSLEFLQTPTPPPSPAPPEEEPSPVEPPPHPSPPEEPAEPEPAPAPPPEDCGPEPRLGDYMKEPMKQYHKDRKEWRACMARNGAMVHEENTDLDAAIEELFG